MDWYTEGIVRPHLWRDYADWESSEDDRRSISGYVFQVQSSTVTWSTKKQLYYPEKLNIHTLIKLPVKLCGYETCYWSLTLNWMHLLYLWWFCIRVAEEPRNHKRLKHIDIKYNFIRKCVQKEILRPINISTKYTWFSL